MGLMCNDITYDITYFMLHISHLNNYVKHGTYVMVIVYY